ncbi:hypothetical protein COL516b_004153 [Colletotrichum fioriniae]|nr:uncharacterized protein COL516b_004153 [Colletotrichum fioriniae]KAJ0307533.1 hypothetical protein COL516b_004153 [Colletotrichum fioriniae]
MDSSSDDHSHDERNSVSEYTGSEDQSSSEKHSIDEHHSAEEDQPVNDNIPIEEDWPVEEPPSEPHVQRHSFFQRPADILFGPFRNAVSNHEIPLWDTLPQLTRPLPPLLPSDTKSDATTNVEILLEELLAQESIEDVEDLCEENPTLRKVFKDNMVQILRKHIAPEAWYDAICCVDRRLKHPGKTARSAFDEDYANGTVVDWPPPPESILVKIIDQLLDRVSQAHKVYASFEEWEESWQDRRPDELPDERWGPDVAVLKPKFSALCRDDGTENPNNMIYAFERHTAHNEERGPVSEGVLMTKTNRAKLQRAFFRLEFIRRAYYQQPFYPRDAEWQTRNDTMVEGVVRGPAGETYAARLARAEKIFKHWASKDEFVEVICAFKATLNEYAIPVSGLLGAFSDTIERYLKTDGVRRAEAACRKRHQETVWNGDAVGLQWEWNPYDLREPFLPAWEIPHSDDFFTLRAQLLDDRADLGRQMDECLPAPLARAEFDARHATIYRSERIRFAPRNRRERDDPSLRKPAIEAQPMHAMSRFLTVMCSLPLSFMGEFLAMESYKKARFLKSAYWAVARVRASRCPSFLSGEMRAWCSNPNIVYDRDGNPVLGPHPRLLPEMSVRAASIACVSKTYEFIENECVGWRLPSRPESQGGWWKWKWDDDRLPAKAWTELHWEMSPFTTKINKVFRMDDVQWAQIWRSNREFERQVWTGRMMDREVWEGYGDPGRVDGNDCYCRWGSGGCGICVPLPEAELPEWELMTPAEVLEESHVSRFMRQPWSKLPDLEPAVKEVFGRSLYRVGYGEAT